MTNQPEAMLLAADLEMRPAWYTRDIQTARLLREQHAEIERLRYHLRTITFSAELVQNYVAQLGADCEEARKERTS